MAIEHGRRRELVRVAVATPRAVVIASAAAWAAAFAALAALRHTSFLTQKFDLGTMTQAVWSTAHGRPLEITEVGGEQIVRLGVHVDPILALFAPLWWLWPSPMLLTTTQAIALGLGALPVFWLGRKHLASTRAAVYLTLAYLAYPALQWNALHEFHPITLAAPLLLYAIWYLDEDRLGLFALFALPAAACQEQVPLLVAGLGAWYGLRHRRLIPASLIVVAGVAWSVLAFAVVIPHFADGPSPYYSRYEDVGGSPGGILATLATDPGRVLEAMTTSRDLSYLGVLFVPLLGVFLLSPTLFLAAGPQLAINLLSQRKGDLDIKYQHSSAIIPFAIAATVLGIARLRRGHVHVAGLVLLLTLASTVLFGPLSLVDRYGAPVPRSDAHLAALRAAAALIPPDAPVSATNQLGGHLSERRQIFSFPNVSRAEWIAVDLRDPWMPLTRETTDRRGFSVPAVEGKVLPAQIRSEVKALREDPAWRLVSVRQAVFVFRRR